MIMSACESCLVGGGGGGVVGQKGRCRRDTAVKRWKIDEVCSGAQGMSVRAMHGRKASRVSASVQVERNRQP